MNKKSDNSGIRARQKMSYACSDQAPLWICSSFSGTYIAPDLNENEIIDANSRIKSEAIHTWSEVMDERHFESFVKMKISQQNNNK